MRILSGLVLVLSLATGCIDDGTETTPLPPNDDDNDAAEPIDDNKFDESLGNSEDTPDEQPNPCQTRREADGPCGL